MLIQFMQRSFGVKNFEKVIRSKYGDSTDPGQEMSNSRFLMHRFKVRINDTAMLLTSNVRAANSIYPTTLHECDVRRDYQNAAIGNCEQLIKDLQQIVEGFQIDVSYMSDDEYEHCMENLFNKLEYREIPRYELTGDKMMAKSVNIGDQLSQIIGIYYPHRIDNYIKYVESEKFYGRYMDDWYIMSPDKARLEYLLTQIEKIATELGIHINMKKTKIVKISSTYKFLQVKYSLRRDGKIIKRINPKRVTALRRKLKKLSLKVQNGEIPYIYVENMFKGWMGSY